MRSVMISCSRISSMPLVSSNRVQSCQYCPFQSLPQCLYSSLMLLSIFSYQSALSRRMWNLPSRCAEDLQIWPIIWVRSAQRLLRLYCWRAAERWGQNFHYQGRMSLSLLVFSRVYERQLARSRLCTLMSPSRKLLNFLSLSSILKMVPSQMSWYSQKTELGTMGMLYSSSSSSSQQSSSSSYSWCTLRKHCGLVMQMRRRTSLSYSEIMQWVSPERYQRMVRQFTFRPGIRFFFCLGIDLALKAWNSQENSLSSRKIIPSDTRLNCLSVFISLFSLSSVAISSVSTDTETVTFSFSLRQSSCSVECSSVSKRSSISMISIFCGLFMVLMSSIDLSRLFSSFLVKISKLFFLALPSLKSRPQNCCIRHFSDSDYCRLNTFIFEGFSFLLGLKKEISRRHSTSLIIFAYFSGVSSEESYRSLRLRGDWGSLLGWSG